MMGDYDETELAKASDSRSAWSRPTYTRAYRSIEKAKRLGDLSSGENGICRLALRTDEAKGFGANNSACGSKNCVYKVNRIVRKGSGVARTYRVAGVYLDVRGRGSTCMSDLYTVATVATPGGRLVLEAEYGAG